MVMRILVRGSTDLELELERELSLPGIAEFVFANPTSPSPPRYDLQIAVDNTSPETYGRTLYFQTLRHWNDKLFRPEREQYLEVWSQDFRRVSIPKLRDLNPGENETSQDIGPSFGGVNPCCLCSTKIVGDNSDLKIICWKRRIEWHMNEDQGHTNTIFIPRYRIVFDPMEAITSIAENIQPILILCSGLEKEWKPNHSALLRINMQHTTPFQAWTQIRNWIDTREWEKRIGARQELYSTLINEENLIHTIHTVVKTRLARELFVRSAFTTIFCVNLDRSPARWESVRLELEKHGLQPTRLSAVDGSNTPVADLVKEGIIKVPHRECRPGPLGCLASHARLWRRLAEEKKHTNTNPPKWYLVLEDDVVLHPDFVHLFPSYWEQLPSTPPDLVYLGCTSPAINEEPGLENEASLLQFATPLKPVGSNLVKNLKTVQGSWAYAITQAGAARLATKYLPTDRAVDYLPADVFDMLSCRRPTPPRAMVQYQSGESWPPWCPELFYTNFGIWGGRNFISLHGLVSVRENVSTVSHASNPRPWYQSFLLLKHHQFWEQAYQYLLMMMRTSFVLNEDERRWVCTDERINCCYSTGRFREAQRAARCLLSEGMNTLKGRNWLRSHEKRLIHNISLLRDKELERSLQHAISLLH